ncbi:rhomboid-domain-containing protein [Byssothecium circinans]|uniref:Rhomboid-domain-containing protein n=1 Tax=Byssothecium circinans TaxID=147558 RepID=A0A6A5U674_9PLEO|nr:rhomboid-domain-containing protein [Byssothecium circinans]
MSLLQRLTRTLRPASFNPATPLRHHFPSKTRPIPSDFYTPSPSISRVGLGPSRRLYTTSTSHTLKLNTNIIYGLIAANSAVFAYAQYAKAQAQQGFPASLVQFYQNFTINYDGVLREGRWWTMITSVFAHTDLMHLLGNMLSIYYLGGLVAQTPGMTPVRLLALVFGSGLSGSVGYLYIRHRKMQESQAVTVNRGEGGGSRDFARGLGFSGSVMGVGAVAAILYPRTQILLYGIVPMPLWALISGYAVFDGYYLNNPNSRIGHAGHIGGLAFGLVYFFARMRGLRIGR